MIMSQRFRQKGWIVIFRVEATAFSSYSEMFASPMSSELLNYLQSTQRKGA